MRKVLESQDLEKRVLQAYKDGRITSDHPAERIEQGAAAGVLNASEANELRELYSLLLEVISVDDFESAELKMVKATNRKKARGSNAVSTQAA